MGVMFTALVVIIPIAELVVFALVADAIGVFPTVLLLLVVSVVGAALLVRQGVGTWRRLRETLRRRERPTDELVDAALIAVAGVLFLTPGFFTDGLAFLVVVPPTRRRLGILLRRVVTSVAVTRLRWPGRAVVANKKVYDVRSKSRSTPGSGSRERPEQLPSSERPSGEADSPDKG